jgi:Zn-dependent oligopeptidase
MQKINGDFLALVDATVPDFDELSKKQNLEIFSEYFEVLLEEEKQEFYDDLKVNDKDIHFELFDKESKLSSVWSLIHHIDNVYGSEISRSVIDTFEPKYIEFSQEV